MKINKTIIYTLTIITVLIFSMCSEEDTPTIDEIKPSVSIQEPQLNDTVFLSKDPELHIEFTAQDNSALENLNVYVTDSSSNEVFSSHPLVAGLKVYSLHKHFIVGNEFKNSNLLLTIKAEDESGNIAIRTVNIYVSD